MVLHSSIRTHITFSVNQGQTHCRLIQIGLIMSLQCVKFGLDLLTYQHYMVTIIFCMPVLCLYMYILTAIINVQVALHHR